MAKAVPSALKLRGGFYTPPEITRFLSNWAITPQTAEILEPSCGDGAFFGSIRERLSELDRGNHVEVLAMEIDQTEHLIAQSRLAALSLKGTIVKSDFFRVAATMTFSRRFDAIVGNPPFLRFQYFPEPSREIAFASMRGLGLSPNRLTNAWVPFVAVSAALLKPGGRLAMVIPAELLQVSYAAQLREFLARVFRRLTLVTFRFLVFEGVQQEVVLVLGEKSDVGPEEIRVLQVDDLEHLAKLSPTDATIPGLPIDHSTEKWTQYFLRRAEFDIVRQIRQGPVARLGDHANVDVGVVTGNNDFFLVDHDSKLAGDMVDQLVRVVHRGSQVRGLETHIDDWRTGLRTGSAKLLLALDPAAGAPDSVAAYLATGEASGVPTGFKCRTRRRWDVVPSTYAPDGFLLRQIHEAPRLSVNRSGATSTDTVHRLRFSQSTDATQLAASFSSSMTFLFSELLGRSYGGGVLELEPSEAEALPVAYSASAAARATDIDKLLRTSSSDELASTTDRVVAEDLGLGLDDLALLREAWRRLRDRRLNRRAPSQKPLARSA